MGININQFSGIAPKVNPPLLVGNMATVATNLRVDSGSLKPIKGTSQVAEVSSTARSLSKYDGSWLHWSASGIDAVIHSPIANDVWERFYYTGDGYPKYTFATRPSGGAANGLKLGVPRPGSAPTLGKSGTPTGSPTDRYYVFTYVTPQGEEGPPSPASAVISVTSTETVSGTFVADSVTNYNLGTGAVRRIYRTAQGVTTSSYEFVKDVPIATLSFTDNLQDSALGSILPSTDWFPPPEDMAGLKSTPNGFLIGFSGNALCVSEILLPHAWNPNNQLAFDAPITALAVTGDSIIVLTETMPYLVTGSSPDSLSAIKIDHPQTCSSKASVVNMGGYVLFASPDGLVKVSANDMVVATQNFLTRDQWQAYSPSTLRGFFYEGVYVGFSDTKAFMFDMRDSPAVLTELSGFDFAAGYNDLTTDTLYLLDTSGNIKSWETGALSTMTWKSKPERMPKPICPSAFRIHADGPVNFKLWADDKEIFNTTVFDSKSRRLPSGYRARQFQFQLSSAYGVDSVAIANGMAELS